MIRITLLLMVMFLGLVVSAQDITGYWTTIDDNTGKERSVVHIYKQGNEFFGKVVKINTEPGDDPNPVCDDCDTDDDRYNQSILGMEIIRNLKKDGSEFTGGDILDAENGTVYRCSLWLDGDDLKVRGYVAFFYRTQTWKRFNGKI